MQYEDNGVNTEAYMADQAANTDVIVKDNGVNIYEDHYYCQRYLQEETDMEDKDVNTEQTRVLVEAKVIKNGWQVFFSTLSPYEMLIGDDNRTHFYTSLS